MINSDILRKSFHSLSQDDVLKTVETDAESGLTSEEAKQRLSIFGRNAIDRETRKNILLIFVQQFKSPIVYLLLFASGISFFFQEWLDGIAILIVLLINSCVGFYMEFQADRSMDALKKLSVLPAKVFRSGTLAEIHSEEIVPGDIIYMEAGDMIAADARILKSSQLLADESALTGESVPVEKQAGQTDENTPLAERTNMLYKSSCLTKGNAHAIVVATGMHSELGKIANLVSTAEQSVTPLEKKLEEFSKTLIKITIAIVVLIFIAGILNGQKLLEMARTSIALAVAAIPEGLPIVATLALAQGMLKMARQNVIVKKLSSVETLGGTNVICSDKTGTLTWNKIVVSEMITENPDIMLRIAVLCNTANITADGKETGDPLETGLLKYAMKQKMDVNLWKKNFPVVKEEPFSSDTKIMSVLCRTEQGYTVYSKGAMEELLERCSAVLSSKGEVPVNATNKKEWLDKAEQMASSGLRVIGGAYKTINESDNEISKGLVFAGLFGMIDPPREDVFDAIRECKTAGVKVVMVTGDHPSTAKNIAHRLGIIPDKNYEVITGNEMNEYEKLNEEEKNSWVNSHVFARVDPKQKLDLVCVLQEKKLIVAMTGDGVNDAPALKKADIGIAMGISGTQVAQEVADMILKDNSFSSIVRAIKEGRIIFENIRKFVIFLLSGNISELVVVAVVSVINLHFQLFPLQILYINIVTDVLPALALGFTGGSDSIMKFPPRNIEEPIIDKKRWQAIISYSLIISIASLGAVFMSHFMVHNGEVWNHELFNNVLFFTLIIAQLVHVFNMGNEGVLFFKTDVFRNKYIGYATFASAAILILSHVIAPVRAALNIYPLSIKDWMVIIGMSLLSLILIQILRALKFIRQ